jgi:hypothetical protein
MQLSKCTRDYALAVKNPFSSYNTGNHPCVPDNIVIPTVKRAFRLKGTFYTDGTTEYGGIHANCPVAPKDINQAVRYTNAVTNYGDGVTLAAATGTTAVNMPVPYSGWATGDMSWRAVACGLKIQYIGTKLNEGGMYHALFEPAEDIDVMTGGEIKAAHNAVRGRITSKPITVVWRPVNPEDVAFSQATNTVEQSLGIVVEGKGPFSFEVVWFYELSGKLIQEGATPSHADPEGLAAVQTTMSNGGANKSDSAFLRDIGRALADMSGWVWRNRSEIVGALEMVTGRGSYPMIEFPG